MDLVFYFHLKELSLQSICPLLFLLSAHPLNEKLVPLQDKVSGNVSVL